MPHSAALHRRAGDCEVSSQRAGRAVKRGPPLASTPTPGGSRVGQGTARQLTVRGDGRAVGPALHALLRAVGGDDAVIAAVSGQNDSVALAGRRSVTRRSAASAAAGLDEGLPSFSLTNLVYTENPHGYKKCQ